jgi:hypothetical protein
MRPGPRGEPPSDPAWSIGSDRYGAGAQTALTVASVQPVPWKQ